MQGLNAIYRPGFKYKKAGVILSGITSSAHNQGDLFETPVRGEALMQTLDMLNRKFGKGAVRISQDAGRRRWAMRQDHKSPAFTTRWDELAEIGRASSRERVCQYGWIGVGAVTLKTKKKKEK